MQFSEDLGRDIYTIAGYQPGEVRVRPPDTGRDSADSLPVRESFLICPERVVLQWTPQNYSELTEEHFEAILELKPEMVILGTGANMASPSPALLAHLYQKRIGCEVMDTAAACRTYNLLAGEGRAVVAGLFMI